MKLKSLGFILACGFALPVCAGQVDSIKGKLKSYTDKGITVVDAKGRKTKIPFTRLILNKKTDLSRMLDKEYEFFYASDIEDAPAVKQ
jgi:hypothetical protein